MAKGVPKELRVAHRKHLRDLVYAKPGTFIATSISTGPLDNDALQFLTDIGAFERTPTGSYRLTAYGREYWDKENTWAPWYWFKKNCFPATVAFATIATSASGIIFNALD